MTNQELAQRDLAHIWHPCSQMQDYESNIPLIPVKSGQGPWITDYDGNRYLDGISSWWVNIFGHNHPAISGAIKEQLDDLEHVIFAGFTHRPAVELAEELVRITPEGLTKIFFADNGSAAVEAALKLSFHYHKNKGEVRPLFLSLENSYHGETLGALAVGGVDLYKETYGELMMENLRAKSPGLVPEEEALADMERLLERWKEEVSAVIVEPLVQCAGGMAMYNPSYLTALRKLCDRYGVHLIADEIAVGFGRTGTLLACDQAGIVPDFLCLSKGITAGYLPLAVVMTTDEVYGRFYCDYNEGKSFLHSHSYTGNPLACAAAVATLKLFRENDVIGENRKKAAFLAEKLERFKKLESVMEVRQRGMIAAVELQGYDPKERVNLKIYRYALSKGVYIRPLGPVVYFMPPYVMTEAELELMTDTAYEAVTLLEKGEL